MSINEDGTIKFDPGEDFNDLAVGESTTVDITYTISDGEGGTDTATATITVTGSNDGPTATDDAATTDEDASIDVDVLANDSDPDASDTLSVTGVSLEEGAGGAVSINEDGTIKFDPGEDFNDLAVGESTTVDITYTISDGEGGTDTATATITVTGSNDGPTATDDTATTDEDASIDVDVLANDSDPDASDTLSVTGVALEEGAGGAVSINEDGTIKFDPGEDFNDLAVGESTTVDITYTISDGEGGTDTATATVTVTGSNDGPTATDDVATTDEDASIDVDVLANDTDPDASDTLSVTGVSLEEGAGGAVSINEDGTIKFDPGEDFNDLAVGESTTVDITYTISDGEGGTDTATATITVTGSNDGPTATDDVATTDEDASIDVDVLANDTDPDASDTLSVTGVSLEEGAGGAVSINEDGTIKFDPGEDFNDLAVGESTTVDITYTISDGEGGTDTATATITVTGSNDGPTATDDVATTDEDASIDVDVLANDTDPDASDTLSVTGVSLEEGAGGAVSINEDGTIKFDPGEDFNDLAVGESTTVDITYTISDGEGGTDTATATITVTGSNDGPTATDDTATTDEDASIDVDVLANDTDPDASDTLSVTGVSLEEGAGGAVSINEDGTIKFDPGEDFNDLAVGESTTVDITYTISDGEGGTDTATATITVTGSNDGPTATDDTATTDEDASIDVDVLANDSDPDASDTLSVTGVSLEEGAGGAVSINEDGTITVRSGRRLQRLGGGRKYHGGHRPIRSVTAKAARTRRRRPFTVTGSNDGPTATDDVATTDEERLDRCRRSGERH